MKTKECEECKGEGRIAKAYPPPCRGFKIIECPHCNGTGKEERGHESLE